MLRFSRVDFAYADGPVLQGLDLAVGPGQLVALLGPSGCGKTTALRLAAGFFPPAAGTIANSFQRTAVVFQEPRLLPWASARDNAAFGLAARGVAKAERRERADALLASFGLTATERDKPPARLSGGMRSRVAIARALAVEPDLVLMDEPFAALDVGLRRELQDLVRDSIAQRATAVLFVTHDVTEAVRLADAIIVLSPRPATAIFTTASTPITDAAAIHAAAAALLAEPAVKGALLER